MGKYIALNVGRRGLLPLLAYELRTSLLGPLPGALGLALRQKLYRGMFGRCGRGVVIGRNVTVRHPHRIAIGENVVIDDNCVLDAKRPEDAGAAGAASGQSSPALTIDDNAIVGRNTILSCKGGTIRIGPRANISVNCTLISETDLEVGARVLIAGHCYLIAGGNHGIDRTDVPIIDQPPVQRGGVSIGDHAWLGAAVTVLDGVKIGRDAVIAAGAVVRGDVPEYAIAVGVPARVLRDRRGA